MWGIIIIICGLMVFSLCMLAYRPKKTYKVRYVRIGFARSEHIAYIKAKDIVDIQKQLDKKENPWDVHILSVEVV